MPTPGGFGTDIAQIRGTGLTRRHLSEATREKISEALKGQPHPHLGHPQDPAAMSAALAGKKHKGHPQTPATRAKISAALKGKKHPHAGHAQSAATKAKISAAHKGKPHPHKGHPQSAAARAKISAARTGKPHPHKGHPMSAEARAKESASKTGKPHPHKGHSASAQTRAKESAAHMGKPHPHKGHPMSAEQKAKLKAALHAYYTAQARHRQSRLGLSHPHVGSHTPRPGGHHPHKFHHHVGSHAPRPGGHHPHRMTAEHREKMLLHKLERIRRAAERMALRRASHSHRAHRAAPGLARHPMTRHHKTQHAKRAAEHARRRVAPQLHPYHPRARMKAPSTARLSLLSAAQRHRLVGRVHTKHPPHRRFKGHLRFHKKKYTHRVFRKNTGHRPTRHL